jgi:hypothetical protein
MRFALFLAVSAPLFAQSIEVGIMGGVPITHDFTAYSLNPNGTPAGCLDCATQQTLPYVVGPAVQIHLWRFLYLDAQGLYSRADYVHTTSGQAFSGSVSFFFSDQYKKGVDRWEIPIFLKLRLPGWRLVHPFVAAGVSLQRTQGVDLPGFNSSGGYLSNAAIGPTFAVGAGFGSRWIRPTIEVRYTRWTDQPFPAGEITVNSKRDETQLLAGLMFGAGRNRPNSPGVLEGPRSNRRVSLGIKGGLPLTKALSTQLSTNSNNTSVFGDCYECGTARTVPYILGPALEVRIVGELSFTAEAFYSLADYDHTFEQDDLSAGYLGFQEKHSVDRWEAPLLLKYSLKMRRLTPFISAGASIQYDRDSRVGAVDEAYCFTCFKNLQAGVYKVVLDNRSVLQAESLVVGPTAGVGASIRVGRVRPSIEARYTYWLDRAIAVGPTQQLLQPPPVGPPIISSPHNQVQLLVGLMF